MGNGVARDPGSFSLLWSRHLACLIWTGKMPIPHADGKKLSITDYQLPIT